MMYVIDPIVYGMGPDSELYDKAKVCTFVKDPIARGKVPLKLFDSKTRRNRLVNNPIVSGIVDAIRWFLYLGFSKTTPRD